MLTRIHCFMIFILLLAPLSARAELVDRVAAVVNGDVITQAELFEESSKVTQKITAQAPASEKEALLKKAREQVLSQLIDKALLLQQAKKAGLSVSDEEVDGAIANILNKTGLSLKQFQKDLTDHGMSEQGYRKTIREQILISRLVNHQIREKIVITDDKIAEYYKTRFSSQPVPVGYHIFQIGITFNDPNSPYKTQEEAKSKALEVQKFAAEGKNFRELAKAFSTLPSARDGGNLGAFSQDELAPAMRTPIMALKPGQVSEVLSTPSGFQILKLQSIREGDRLDLPALETMQDELKDLLMQEESTRQYEAWLARLRTEAYIKRLLE